MVRLRFDMATAHIGALLTTDENRASNFQLLLQHFDFSSTCPLEKHDGAVVTKQPNNTFPPPVNNENKRQKFSYSRLVPMLSLNFANRKRLISGIMLQAINRPSSKNYVRGCLNAIMAFVDLFPIFALWLTLPTAS